MLWSILIAAIPERYHSAHKLLMSLLENQGVCRMSDIELLYLMDNRRRSVGAKRNDLLSLARGEYVSYIDDDDEVAPYYVERIHRTIVSTRKSETPADVICFPQRCLIQPHGITHECTYSLAHWKDRKPEERRQLAPAFDGKGVALPNVFAWTGPPAHTMVWRAGIAKACQFPERQFGEDVEWVDKACALAVQEIQIVGEPMYYYHYDESKTTTRG